MEKLGFGLMRLPLKDDNFAHIDLERVKKMADAFIEAGGTYFDTAYPYHEGKSEEESVLIESGDDGTSPYIVQEREPEIEGILVVCGGGDSPSVQREIIAGISALFPVESHKIKVMKSKEAK